MSSASKLTRSLLLVSPCGLACGQSPPRRPAPPVGKDPLQGWWLPTREYVAAWNAYALNAKGTVAAPDKPAQ